MTSHPTPTPDPDPGFAALDARLRASAPPRLADDGFTARVTAALAREAAAAAAIRTPPAQAAPPRAPWLSPAEAARRVAGDRRHRAHMRRWTRRGLVAGGAVAALAFVAQAGAPAVPGSPADAATFAWFCVSLTLAVLVARELSAD